MPPGPAARTEAKAVGAAEAAGAKTAVGEGKPKGADFTDFRTDADMQALHQQLRSIKAKPEDFLYTPPEKIAADSIDKIEKLVNNLKKDLGVTATPVEVSPGKWKLRVDHVPAPPQLPEV